ncbi:MAG: lytic transglycosylase domain-containing protein [Chromatiaceae bacterium]|nr:lytic transglycosylase domain-containing protein [Chromatiaceae bacterium]
MGRSIGIKILWIVLIALVIPGTGWSSGSVPAGYRSIAAEQGVPHSLLYAVALAESGKQIESAKAFRPWPWTLNLAGQGYFYETRSAAWQALTAWLREGRRSIDIGLMQVNWRYHRERLGTTWQALDPYHNLRVGAAILKQCYQTRRDWWSSVGCYHAPADAGRAARYRQRVVSHWRRIEDAG